MRLLQIDIETAPNKVYAWGLFDQSIAINQIVEPGYTMCFAAKWRGESPIIFESVHSTTPRKMVQRAWQLLDEADAVVHYNGTRFDIPTLNREFLYHGFEPPTPFKEIDLLRTVRQRFKFPSNKLDYVAQQLGLGSKTKHMGMELWRDCMDGCPKAWKIMERYNKQDVRLLEKLYDRLLPWIKNHPNVGVWIDSDDPTCRNCGSTNLISKGEERTNTMTYQRYRCKNCRTPLRARTRLKPASKGLTV